MGSECRLEPTLKWDLPQGSTKKDDRSRFRFRRENRIRDPWSWLTGTRRKTKESSFENGIELQKIAEKVEEIVPLKNESKLSQSIDSKNVVRKKVKKKKKVRTENDFVSSDEDGVTQMLRADQSPTRELKLRQSDLNISKMRKTDQTLSFEANIFKTDRNLTSDTRLYKTEPNLLIDAKDESDNSCDAIVFKTDSKVLSDAKMRQVESSPIDALWICSASLISTEGGRGEARPSKNDRNLTKNVRNSDKKDRNLDKLDRNSDEDLDQEVEKYLKEVDKRLSVDHLADLNVS